MLPLTALSQLGQKHLKVASEFLLPIMFFWMKIPKILCQIVGTSERFWPYNNLLRKNVSEKMRHVLHTRLSFIDTCDILHAVILFMWKNEHRVHKRKSSKKCSRERDTRTRGETQKLVGRASQDRLEAK